MCSTTLLAALQKSLALSDAAAGALCTEIRNEVALAVASDSSTQHAITGLRIGLNTQWLMSSGALAFIMHAGFAMLCAGAIRSKNTMNILLQTVLDACGCALSFYICGFAFAYGEGEQPNKFIGDSLFTLSRFSSHYTGTAPGRWTDWFFAYVFAATAATIPAGAVAERFNFNAYLGYTVFISSFVYPVVVHWVWSRQGWLTYTVQTSTAGRAQDDFLFGSGMIDFAGSAVVHMVGGLSGLMGCMMVGPRLGRFDMHGNPVEMPGHSAVLSVLGTVLLWFGWYGFNPGSILTIDTVTGATVAARAAVTTTLSGAAGGVSCLFLAFMRHKAWDLMSLCNGVLVGFVSVTAGAHVIEPWAAILVGALGSVIFEACCALMLKLKIDDPLSASPMHGICGAWAVLFVGLLAKEEYVLEAYGRAPYYGLFYGGGGALLASQIVGLLAIAAWTCGLMGAFFALLQWRGILRIPPDQEHQGLDVSAHGGAAYNHYDTHTAAGVSKHSVNSDHKGGMALGAVFENPMNVNSTYVAVDQYGQINGVPGGGSNHYKPFASTVGGPAPPSAMLYPQHAEDTAYNGPSRLAHSSMNSPALPSSSSMGVIAGMSNGGSSAAAAMGAHGPPAAAPGAAPAATVAVPSPAAGLSGAAVNNGDSAPSAKHGHGREQPLATTSRMQRMNDVADDILMAPAVKRASYTDEKP